jgi:hypothetical protein
MTVSYGQGLRTDTYIDMNGYNQAFTGTIRESARPPFAAGFTWGNDSTNSNSLLTFGGSVTNTLYGSIQDQITNTLPPLMTVSLSVTNGTLCLLGTNTYSGGTTVSNATLLVQKNWGLQQNGSYAVSTFVPGGWLGNTTVNVNNGGVFGGDGTVNGNVNINAGATLTPGDVFGWTSSGSSLPPTRFQRIGTLILGGSALTLDAASTNIFEVDNALHVNDAVFGIGNLSLNGTLIVSNYTQQPYTNGQTLKLFDSPTASYGATTFSSISLPGVLGYIDSLKTNGTIIITSAVHSWNPTNIVFSKSGTNLNLSWPSDHNGWILQCQTNALNTGFRITNIWYDVPGSGSVTNTSIPIDKTNPTMFFRLRFPN